MQAFEIPNQPSIQQPLIAHLVDELRGHGRSPSTGLSAARTNAVIDQVLRAYRARHGSGPGPAPARPDAHRRRHCRWPASRRRDPVPRS
ncbi:hypothetical protein G6F66_014536 [Rhizopus arrhizus]|nr:hypothetical protein G6F68_018857 [Rhizopus microsporus]KAG1258862.1 hypothetical protein G6F66_014536 [Rhizopus arrhizus]